MQGTDAILKFTLKFIALVIFSLKCNQILFGKGHQNGFNLGNVFRQINKKLLL